MTFKYYTLVDRYTNGSEVSRLILLRADGDYRHGGAAYADKDGRHFSTSREESLEYWQTSTRNYEVVFFQEITREKALAIYRSMK